MNWFKRFFSKADTKSTQADDQPPVTASAAATTTTLSETEPSSVPSTPFGSPPVEDHLPPSAGYLQDRQIRVFISSPFSDMQEDRELLINKVFPELRRLNSERFVSFTEKVTEEQFQFLTEILDVHNRRLDLDLDARFPLWAAQRSLPLDDPWTEMDVED